MLTNLEHALTLLRRQKPLVLCLTNQVTMDFMANCLLSLGAAPVMTQDAEELEELIFISQAININIGTLDHAFLERAKHALTQTNTLAKPIILDPVGAGATRLRTRAAKTLANGADIIRGNASEIMALVDNAHQTLGVESTHNVSDAKQSARTLANQHQCTVVVSGAEDFITDGSKDHALTFGSPLMPLVTGMGCALTAVIAAFRAVISSPYEAACIGTNYFSLCGSLAAKKGDKPGSFRTLFIDELYTADIQAMGRINHEL